MGYEVLHAESTNVSCHFKTAVFRLFVQTGSSLMSKGPSKKVINSALN